MPWPRLARRCHVRQFVQRNTLCLRINVGVIAAHGDGFVSDDVAGNDIADASVLEQTRGGVTETVKAQVVLLVSNLMAFSRFFEAPRLRQSRRDEDLIELLREIAIEIILGVTL